MPKEKALKLPRKIYVRWNDELENDLFLDVQQDIRDHARLHGDVKVGVYELRSEKEVSNRSTID